jgi:hypothetical protein
MRQSKLLAQQAINRPRRMEHFRRKTWADRRIHRSQPLEIADQAAAREFIPGEFEDPPRFPAFATVRRGVGLASDISLLILLSPFFAAWFLYRAALRFKRPKT